MEPSWGTGNDSYYLQPNSSVTLDYSGNMQLDPTSMGLVPDTSYTVDWRETTGPPQAMT